MKLKRFLSVLLSAVLVSSLFTAVGFADETEEATEAATEAADDEDDDGGIELSYPIWDVTGIVPWGDGGQTDTIMRALGIAAEQPLGQTIDVQNMPGNTGADGLEYVYDENSDGYTILMAAENPTLYKALGISDLDYDDFECVLLVGDQTTAVVVAADSPYDTITDLVGAAVTDDLVIAGTGTGGLPWTAGGLLSAVIGIEFGSEEYDGDASAIQAVEDGECDFTICKIGAAIDDYRSGDLKMLCVLADEAASEVPDVQPITQIYPLFKNYLPWGPFCGVFVKNDTDPAIVSALTKAFQTAFNDSDFQQVLSDNCVNPMGLSGNEAEEYIKGWQDETISALQSAGVLE